MGPAAVPSSALSVTAQLPVLVGALQESELAVCAHVLLQPAPGEEKGVQLERRAATKSCL